MRSGFLQIDGGTLETGWWGPGPADASTLVLLHEGLGSVALWRDVPERLAAATGLGVFAYSRFGYGHSDGVTLPRPMTYMQDEALVVLPQVLRTAGIQRAVLIGHSDGGSIAAVYAGSVAVSSPPASSPPMSWPPVSWPGLARPSTSYDVASGKVVGSRAKPGYDTGGEDFQPTLLGLITIAAHFFVEDLNIASIQRIKADYETGTLRQRLARYHRDVDTAFRGWNNAWLDPRFRDFDITRFLPHIHVPILALQGQDDPYGTDEQIRTLEANVQAPITTQLIAGARHSPHLEAMDATLAAITAFIANLPREPST
ncbi:alpha/beta fold hydrolase [Acidisphaera sp. S103]|uniref:alpha/beta fold hydrolase n=1 Tax=Acidisphaera sp. S103 TaxID=1747223 RepID=UPI00131E1267|nr:alpha/beta hydrolase [Acidisphaera sp. S103]